MSSLDHFTQVTRQWFTGAFEAPTAAQEGAWESIARGDNTLVVAPTGSGKTLAAFLWSLDRLAAASAEDGGQSSSGDPDSGEARSRETAAGKRAVGGRSAGKQAGGAGHKGTRVLYVSPLKALAVDVERNLRAPLAGLKQTARRLGQPVPEISVAIRSGDTPAEDRRRFAAHPSDILITTPESLFLLLTSQAREALRGVETVIVDEVHAVAATKRGAHLALTLERLDALLDRPAQRVGLSATVRPVSEVAAFLGGSRPATVVQPPSDKQIEVEVVVPVEDMTELDGGRPQEGDEEPASRSIWPHVEERLFDLIGQHSSTIVFANSRRLAERLCTRLNELAYSRERGQDTVDLSIWETPLPDTGPPERTLPERMPVKPLPPERMPAELMAQAGVAKGVVTEVVRAHHGSVSKEERAQIEEALKSGRLPAVVATSSLELGIDMGAVDLVACVEAPPSVASGLQRIGRAGHQVGAVSKGVIFPKYRGDLVQTAVVAERMKSGQIEELRYPRNPLDVLAQQIVAMTALEEWTVDELEAVVKRAAPYATLPRSALEATLDMLAGRYPSEEFAELRPRIVWDRVTGTLQGRPGAQRLAVTNGGTIPDRGLFGVFLVGERASRVGELDEEMVYESRVGDVFVLGASSWRIEDITADRVLVSPAPGQPGKLPFWHGDTPGRPAELGRAIGQFLREQAKQGSTDRMREAGLDEFAAGNLLAYLDEQRQATGYVPDDRTLLVERFHDELGDWRVVIHSPYGARVHAPWALAINRRLRERYGIDVQAVHSDDGIVLRIPDTLAEPPTDVAAFDAEEIEQIVTEELGGSAMFAARFRECAGRALLLPRRTPGRRSPLWQQRQRAAHLLGVASQYASFPIVLETMRECLQDVFDVPGLVRLMRDIAARRVRLVEVETSQASPFAASLLFHYIGAFMYEGDAPLAERRAQALALDTRLLAELLGQADLRELLDPDVISDSERELARLDRPLRDLEDLADLLRSHGPLPALDVSVRGGDPAWLDELERARRAIRIRIAGEEQWTAIEDAARMRDALGVPLPVGVPHAFLEPVADPLADLVARHARTRGPFHAGTAAARFGLGVAVVTDALRRLAASGRVVSGEFRPGGRGEEWCDAGVLRMLRRRSLARLRKEVEPVAPETLALFLPAWHGITGVGQGAAGPGGAGVGAVGPGGAGLGGFGSGGAGLGGAGVGAAGSGGFGSGGAGLGGLGSGGAGRAMDALVRSIEQLQGAVVPASALETLVLPSRVPGYHPALLDELTSSGEVMWAGQGSLPGGDGWVSLYFADTAPLLLAEPGEITIAPVHERVLELLGGGGALFFRGISDQLGSLDDVALVAALWDLVWSGRVSGDTLAPLRATLGTGRPAHRPATTRRRRAVLPSRSGPPTVAGRWWLLPSPADDPTQRAHAQAEVLLERHGVVTRGSVTSERLPGGFTPVYQVLRAYEESGRCRRGYFVEGLGGAQFALPGAVDRMRAMAPSIAPTSGGEVPGGGPAGGAGAGTFGRVGGRGGSGGRRAVVLAAADPASPYGAALPWPQRPGDVGHKPGRKAGSLVVLVDGYLVLYVERGGKTLLSFADDERLQPAVDALALAVRDGALGKLTVERADGASIVDSPLAAALEAAGFHPTPRGLRLRA
ncbi:ATP-dependent helicase Lhr and Lhr-like helicase [Nonomuraea jiangxiensis]|uniref:ATP-dependent helicase Lhr and Lhr-like helicase n=1 Tax=Nonomuraea jiangxiensis TaxID=633440 RepID=A0A1G7Y8V2_9ACTN|nr:DEAD/DEAH box helicase [Nonomuraea jiangxiensis]SDG92892.1 ATP-dependent helicase Lhr and Lhr-like helicase [Nonomuraea jiangxiensis]